MERAYIDYFISPVFTFTFGRLPTSEGPPNELLDDTSRKSTYPNALWETELDGVVFTANLFKNRTFSPTIRAIYGELGYLTADNGQYTSGDNEKSSVYLVQLESALNIGQTEGFIIFDSMILSNYYPDWDISGYEKSGDTFSLGSVNTNLIHLQFNDIAGKGFDFYTNYAATAFHSNGNRIEYKQTSTNDSNQLSTLCTGIGQPWDCSKASEEKQLSGHAVNIGLRYQMPIDILQQPKVGVEYHEATNNYFKPDYYSDYNNYELVFQNVIGKAVHVYWLQPLEKSTFLRAGIIAAETFDTLKPFPTASSGQSFLDAYILINTRF